MDCRPGIPCQPLGHARPLDYGRGSLNLSFSPKTLQRGRPAARHARFSGGTRRSSLGMGFIARNGPAAGLSSDMIGVSPLDMGFIARIRPASLSSERLVRLALAALPERRELRQAGDLRLHAGPLAAEEILHRRGKAGIGDPVGAPGGRGQVAALDLVLALGARLDPRQLVPDRVVDGLIVAGLEVQEPVLAETAPMAAIERIAARAG